MATNTGWDAKDISMVIGMALLTMITVGSFVYNVYDTGNELTCRTGNGWTILEESGGVFKSQCQYLTKDWVTAYCSSFRSTSSYERYGCHEVALVEVEVEVPSDPEIIEVPSDPIIVEVPSEPKVVIIDRNEVGGGATGAGSWICSPDGCVAK